MIVLAKPSKARQQAWQLASEATFTGRRFGRRAPLLRGARSGPSGGEGLVGFNRKAAVNLVQKIVPELRIHDRRSTEKPSCHMTTAE